MTCQLVGSAFTKPAKASTWAAVIGVFPDNPPQQVVSTELPPTRRTGSDLPEHFDQRDVIRSKQAACQLRLLVTKPAEGRVHGDSEIGGGETDRAGNNAGRTRSERKHDVVSALLDAARVRRAGGRQTAEGEV